MFDDIARSLYEDEMTTQAETARTNHDALARRRRENVFAAANLAGLLGGVRRAVGARVPEPLIDAARMQTGLTSTTEVIEYALAKLALEDDFGAKLVARRGRVSKSLDLEF